MSEKINEFANLEKACEKDGLKELKEYMIKFGYENFSFRKSSRPTQGSPCYKTSSLSNEVKIKAKIYKPKTTKIAGKTIVMKTHQGYFEFWNLTRIVDENI